MSYEDGKVCLIDGKLYDPWNPSGPAPSPETVAHGLANLCRYGGHVTRFYSVAEHSIWVALKSFYDDEFESKCKSKLLFVENFVSYLKDKDKCRLALFGLIHDAPEGCGLVDVPGPIVHRQEMKEYKLAHERCMIWLCKEWGIESPNCWSNLIKEIDNSILGAESILRPTGVLEERYRDKWKYFDLMEGYNLTFNCRYLWSYMFKHFFKIVYA